MTRKHRVKKTRRDIGREVAQAILRPAVQGATTIAQWKPCPCDVPLGKLVNELQEQAALASLGDLARSEAMLVVQAHTLDAIFNDLARRASTAEYLPQLETYLRLGLKAQSQCRATVETLALMKNPTPTTFVRQANIANNQQVNNASVPAALACAEETKIEPNKLLETDNGERLDFGTAGQTIGGNSSMETVEVVQRTKDAAR